MDKVDTDFWIKRVKGIPFAAGNQYMILNTWQAYGITRALVKIFFKM